ncbi:MAG: NADH-ubiquinone oxidoreductase-F iron-sulfur binding region domain-containing protein [Pseudomonadota bacterium]
MTTLSAYISLDTTSRSIGADEVAALLQASAVQHGTSVSLTRTGTRGLFWLEPMIEFDTDAGRVAFGPLDPGDVRAVSTVISPKGELNTEHPAYLGLLDEVPEFAGQLRHTYSRVGVTDPLSLAQYRAHHGYEGLQRALSMNSDDIVEEIANSGLRGRGGAAFPTGIKMRTVAAQNDTQKYIVCNADEGDSGTFADRIIMEGDPFLLIEGMTIAGVACGATQGYIYVRSEYPQAITLLNKALATAYEHQLLGENVMASGKQFDLEVRKAAGAYICGEETSLLESLEGKRGLVRFKPPLPAIEGLFGKPTLINNVVSLVSMPEIVRLGADSYHALGVERSRGTLTVQLAGNVKKGGLFEVPFGTALRDVIEQFGGGTLTGRPVKAVQIGGPLGAFVPPAHFDMPLDYEAFAARGAMIGHGGMVVFDDTADMGEMARFSMEFCAIESCGKCTPCRIGAVRGTEVIDKIRRGEEVDAHRILLRDLCNTMVDGSLCALGGMAPFPVLSVMDHFEEEL